MNQAPRRNAAFLVLLALAAGCAAVVWFGLPHDREVKSLWLFLFKLLPFVFAVAAVARLDVELARRLHLVRILLPAALVVYFLYFVPTIFFYLDDFPTVYYHILVLTPILIMVSGIEDLAFLTVNNHTEPPYNEIPAVWTWASHMTVFPAQPRSRCVGRRDRIDRDGANLSAVPSPPDPQEEEPQKGSSSEGKQQRC